MDPKLLKKYAFLYAQQLKEENPELALIGDEGLFLKAVKLNPQRFDDYVKEQESGGTNPARQAQAAELRRQVFKPTEEEWTAKTLPEKASFLSQKQGMPFGSAMSNIATMPRSAQKYALAQQDPSAIASAGVGARDIWSMPGRAIGSLFGDENYVEGLGTQGAERSTSLMGGLGQAIVRDPELIPSALASGGTSLLKKVKAFPMMKRALAVGGAGGMASIGSQLAGGEEMTPTQAMVELVASGGGEVGGELAKRFGSQLFKSIRSGASKASGPNMDEAFEFYQTPGAKEALIMHAGTQDKIGKELVYNLVNFDEKLKEVPEIFEALSDMPDIDITPAIEALEAGKKVPVGGRPLKEWEKKANIQIDNEINDLTAGRAGEAVAAAVSEKKAIKELGYTDDLEKMFLENVDQKFANAPAGEGANVYSAEGVYDLRKAIDSDFTTGKQGHEDMEKVVNDAIFGARTAIKNSLEEAAVKSGKPEYVKAMRSLAEKLQARDKAFKLLGSNKEVAAKRSESFISNLYNAGKTHDRQVLREFDRVFGSKTSEQARIAAMAKKFGPTGVPEFGSAHFTGRGEGGMLSSMTGAKHPIMTANLYWPMLTAAQDVTNLAPEGTGAALMRSLENATAARSENR
jgi:hypothetical protein